MTEDGRDGTCISVRNLWKVFGKNGEAVIESELGATGSKQDVLEKTGAVIAIRDVSFEVRTGEVFVVMGLSGCGKSTLARCLIRLVEPSRGEIVMQGEDVTQYDGKQLIQLRRERASLVFQHFGLLPHRRVLDNAAYGLEVRGVKREARYQRAREVLERVGLKGWERAYPWELSGGMQQRVGLARALAVEPAILLMDEPFSGLDPLIRRDMQDDLILLQGQIQKTIVFITHDLDEALKLGSRIAIMRDGEIIQTGTPEEIVATPVDSYVEEFTRGIRKTRVMGARKITREPAEVVFEWQGPRVALHVMRTHNTPHAFVLGYGRTFKGVVTAEEAATAAERGVASLREVAIQEYPSVSPDTPIDELVPLAAAYESAIAVVDDRGVLLGVVPRAALLESLAESSQAQGQRQPAGTTSAEGNGG